MKEIKTEYKLLIILAIIFFFILFVILAKYNVLSKNIDKLKTKNYIKCIEEKKNKGVGYTENYCTITDDDDFSYVISYPKIDINSKDVRSINNKLRKEYDRLKNKINYVKAGEKFYIDKVNSLEYSIYNYEDILSILVKQKLTNEKTFDTYYKYEVYNIDIKTGKIIKNEEMKNRLKINLDLSSKIRMKVIEMYAQKFQYDYIGKLSYLRNRIIDQEVEKITYSNMSELYVDDIGNINFMYDLYNPDKKTKDKYLFIINKDKKIEMQLQE